MAENKSATNIQQNTFIQGMNRDLAEHVIDSKLYRYAENITVLADKDSEFGHIQPRDHIYPYNSVIPEDEQVLGVAITKVTFEGTIENVLVVLTRVGDTNKLYRIVGLDTGKLSIKYGRPYIDADLDITTECSMFCNVETSSLTKLYICDGVHQLRAIDISLEDSLNVTDPTVFDMVPNIMIGKPEFVKYIAGKLPASKVQYFIRLFKKNGQASNLSPGSGLIPIAKTPDNKIATGLKADEIGTNGVQLKIDLSNVSDYFDYLQVYRVMYKDDSSLPTVAIINEAARSSNSNFQINDTGGSVITEVSVEEFLALLTNSVYIPKIAQPHGTRMYLGNVTEDSFDLDENTEYYDTRAYRCDSNGFVVIESSNGESATYDIKAITSGSVIIPKEHDCINPSNSKIGQQDGLKYVFGKTGEQMYLGGAGPNVSFKFVYAEICLSNNVCTNNTLSKEAKLIVDNKNSVRPNIPVTYGDGTEAKAIKVDSTFIPDYSDPNICEKVTGYKRDEVYSFGVVFYNQKGQKSPVHWIADIKMPSPQYTYKTNDIKYLHPFAAASYSKHYAALTDLNAYPIGVEFTFNNLPEVVSKYEIVRCDRTALDRTIVSQGILSNIWCMPEIFKTQSNTWCFPWAWPFAAYSNEGADYAFDKTEGWRNYNGDIELKRVKNAYEYISPESCFSDLSNDLLVNKEIKPVSFIASYNRLGNKGDEEYDDAVFVGFGEPTEITYPYQESTSTTHAPSATWNSHKMIPHVGKTCVGTMKYFFNELFGYRVGYNIVDSIAGRIDIDLVFLDKDEAYVSLTLNLQEWDYININRNNGFGERDVWSFCAHGKNNVIKIDYNDSREANPDDSYKLLCYGTRNDKNGKFGYANTVPLCNVYDNTVTQYGGNSYAARTNRYYVSTGCIGSNGDGPVVCFGGDTYLGILDHQTSSIELWGAGQWENGDEWRTCTCVNSLIPLESTYNLALRGDDSLHKLILRTGSFVNNYLIGNKPRVCDLYVQDYELYQYNTVYSEDGGTFQTSLFTVDTLHKQVVKEFTNRVVASQAKIPDNVIDDWCQYKVADYIDIDFNHGLLTNIRSFFNKLYYFTETSLGILSTNERALVTDNSGAELVLGTGTILSRYDTIVDKNGSLIVNDKSIVTSDLYIYWYDSNSNEICRFGNGLAVISKVMGIQSDLNKLSVYDRKLLVKHKQPVSLYDKKYNEVWLKINDKPVIFNETLNKFTAYYTHSFNLVANDDKYLITFDEYKPYYIHDLYGFGDSIDRLCKLTYVVNEAFPLTKVFDNVWFTCDISDDVITDIYFTTKMQVSEHLDLSKIENREDNYRFFIPREQTTEELKHNSMTYAGRMRGKYLISNYEMDCNGTKDFEIPYINTTYRYSRL